MKKKKMILIISVLILFGIIYAQGIHDIEKPARIHGWARISGDVYPTWSGKYSLGRRSTIAGNIYWWDSCFIEYPEFRKILVWSIDSTDTTVITPTGISLTGYIRLGDSAPVIKMKKLTGTTPNEGASGTIAHGLTTSKIIGAQVLVNNNTGNRIPPNFTSVADHEFDFFIDATDVHIYCITLNSSNIDNNAVTVLITYEE